MYHTPSITEEMACHAPRIDRRHQLEPPLSSALTHRCSELSQPNNTAQPILKKQRVSHSSGSETSAAFWDDLSKVWLTRRALREHDRRSTQAAPTRSHLLHQRARRPVTQHYLADSKRNSQTAQETAGYIHFYCEPSILKKVKLFAKHGGPNLLDLRNVRAASYLLAGEPMLMTHFSILTLASRAEYGVR
jgi:hypothetical protein